DNVIVILKSYPAGVELARDTSDAWGNYQFLDVPDGSYLLSYDKYTADTMQWGNDINVADVSMLKYLIASDTLQDPSRCFASRYRKAGNVDNNQYLNVIDVSRIKSKIASPYLADKNFPKGNWVALNKAVTVSGADVNIDLETICCGDYNASSTKYRDSLYTWNNTKSMEQENIIYTSEENMMLNNASSIELPLSISEKMNEFSALGLELKYPYHEYQLVDVKIPKAHSKNNAVKINPSLEEIIAENDDLLVTDENGTIRIVYATTMHFDVEAGETLIVFRFHPLQAMSPGELDFSLTGSGLWADQYGETNDEAYLLMPKIFVQGDDSDSGFEFAGYPNPFDGEVEINYSLPESGTVKLNVYNVLGELVSELVNDIRASGKHRVLFPSKELPAGMYTFRLEYIGLNSSKCVIMKLVHH
ncbi:MAG TPA: T9SS type A sorting domain-containing protein, partial [Bacteroidales bacterium]|nr:T9SS type A sorting domain-containing protein [Bacteroidales bacterium]